MNAWRRLSLGLMALFYTAAGIMHFAHPSFYVQIMPASLPAPLFLVYLSGVCESALGLLLLVPRYRRLAAWGVILLLIAVFPANINMALHHDQLVGMPASLTTPLAVWLRLPFQLLFIAWAFSHTGAKPRRRPPPFVSHADAR